MRKTSIRLFLWLALALISGTGFALPAAAHAVLISSDPPDHAILARAPARIRLTFDEPIALTELKLIGPGGKPVSVHARATDANITAAIPNNLDTGIYTLSYRVVSADGHVVGGAVQFGVGAGIGTGPGDWNAPGSDISILRWWLAGCDWIAMLGGFLSFGLPLPGQAASAARRRCGDVLAAVSAAAALAAIGFQGLAMTGSEAAGLARPQIWLAGAASPTAQFAGMLAAGLLLQRASIRVSERWRATTLAIAAAFGVLAFATTGHVFAIGSAASAVLAIHVACAWFWVGALLPLLARLRDAEPADALRRFSQLALPAVIMLVIAGAIIAYLQVRHVNQILTTTYGIVLTAKLALVAIALSFAGVNRWVLTPAIDRGEAAALRRAFVSIRVELVLLAAILALTAALGQLTPPRHLLVAEQTAATHPLFTDQMSMDRGAMAMATMAVAASGAAGLTVDFTDAGNRPVQAKNVLAEFVNLDTGAGPLRQALAPEAGSGRYRTDGILLVPRGHWRMTIKADFSDFDRRIFVFYLKN
jgi:copper transport protein